MTKPTLKMALDESQELQGETLEFDLDFLLYYSQYRCNLTKTSEPIVGYNSNDSDRFPLIRREITSTMPSPIELDAKILQQYESDGLSSQETNLGQVFRFSTKAFEAKPSSINNSLFQIYSKQTPKLKRTLIISFNLLDCQLSGAVKSELRFITSKLKRCGENVELTKMWWALDLNPTTQIITSRLLFCLDLKVLLFRYFLSDVVTMIDEILKWQITELAVDSNEENSSLSKLPLDVHLFYRAMAENSKDLPMPKICLSHPYITAKLYPFQQKTINWLLNREHVNVNSAATACEAIPFISEETLALFESFPYCDQGALEKDILHILDCICFGWKRVLHKNIVCWYNDYTGNIMMEAQMLESLISLAKCSEKSISTDADIQNDTHSEIGGSGFLGEEMGLGKTVEIISLVMFNQRHESQVGKSMFLKFNEESDPRKVKKAKTTLVAAPQSIIKQWYSEISRMCPHLLVTIYKGLRLYRELRNIPKYIAEYLRRYDIVLMNYWVMSQELDFALYSSHRASTREGRGRRGVEIEIKEKDHTINVDVEALRAHFVAPISQEIEEITYSKKKFDRANLEEIGAKARKEYPGKIPHTLFYDSPLMMCQWWRVVLDEMQMVATGASRSFKTAAMIPRVHSWGVSGTPPLLLSVLEFLKVSPFDFTTANFSWRKLNNGLNNRDFIKLWKTVGLRHTKAKVHNDIDLPPQERVLLTLPFTELEQDAYDQLFADSLLTVGLQNDYLPKGLKLNKNQCLLLRHSLFRLRQSCANTQVGKLDAGVSAGGKNNRKVLLANTTNLKTLESVLDDMITSVMDELLESEKTMVTRILEVCQVLENSLYPEKVVEVLTFLLAGVLCYFQSHKSFQQELRAEVKILESEIKAVDSIKRRGVFRISEDELSDSESKDIRPPIKVRKLEKTASSELPTIVKTEPVSKEDEKKYVLTKETLRKKKDQLNATRIKLRSWKVIEHKCYFLLASAHFQLYDPEYQEKVKKFRDPFDLINTISDSLSRYTFPSRKFPLIEGTFMNDFVEDKDLTPERREIAIHKHLESVFYSKAEASRNEILSLPLKEFENTSVKKLQKMKLINKQEFVNDGQKMFPKTTKSLLLYFPVIELDDLQGMTWNILTREFVVSYLLITHQLNKQVEFLNELLVELKGVLESPLLSIDKSPDGEEYAQSIDNQDRAATLMLLISQLLKDRASIYFEEHEKTIAIRKKQADEFSAEAHQISDQKYLKALQKRRASLRPQSDNTIEELLKALNYIELDSAHQVNCAEILETIVKRVRISAENEKTSQNILQKQINSVFNPVFNSRVEYFKQLQQISDTVENNAYPHSHLELDGKRITEHLNSHLGYLAGVNKQMIRLRTRLNYLESLVRLNKDSLESKKDQFAYQSQEELICLICQGEITLGALTSCGHRFCKLCLIEWLTRHPSCPMCKSYTDRDSVYFFTVYKADIKVQKVENLHSEMRTTTSGKNQVYKHLDPDTLKEIQNIPLENSYGSKVDLIVRQVLYLKSVDPEVQIVIFSQWLDLLYILAQAFDQAKITHVTATNSSAVKRKDSDNPTEQFKKKDNGITCFLLNAQIQASGLTLVNASHIFLCEPLVSTPTELQAISRIHRIGQKKETTVWMFAVEKTVEENIVALGTKKRLRYLQANAQETENFNSDAVGIDNSKDSIRLEEKDLLTAESEAITYASVKMGSYYVEDEDISLVYFGEQTTVSNDEKITAQG